MNLLLGNIPQDGYIPDGNEQSLLELYPDEHERFNEFIEDYGKSYESEEEYLQRFANFLVSLQEIEELQAADKGTAVYGVTEFSDYSKEEREQLYNNEEFDSAEMKKSRFKITKAKIPDVKNLPENFDWRDHNVVGPVRYQGGCGSCWLFAGVQNVESLHAIKHGELYKLSEQELIDCAYHKKGDRFGCKGGNVLSAYRGIYELGGLVTDEEYPYHSGNTDKPGKCKLDKREIVAKVKSAVKISRNETDMAKWLFKNGPIAVAVNPRLFEHYNRGVVHLDDEHCNPNIRKHAVLIVGFGVENDPEKGDVPYWILKNSWGESNGIDGYYKVFRGSGVCGINKEPSSAVVE